MPAWAAIAGGIGAACGVGHAGPLPSSGVPPSANGLSPAIRSRSSNDSLGLGSGNVSVPGLTGWFIRATSSSSRFKLASRQETRALQRRRARLSGRDNGLPLRRHLPQNVHDLRRLEPL